MASIRKLSTSVTALVSLGFVFSSLVAACASAPERTGGAAADNTTTEGAGGGFGAGGTNNSDEPVSTADLEACATSSAKAEASRVYLVFMFDRSGSMTEGNRWEACKTATKAFFASKESAGISASLHYFPIMGLVLPSCDAKKYAKPAVGMISLPNGAFASSLDTEKPGGGTPTGPAITGALQYAKQMQGGLAKNGKVAIVLVSDGDPEGCGDDGSSVAKIVSTAAQTIPTYVIGVGDVKSLDAIAQAGGTHKAFVVPTGDPTKIQGDFRDAVETIKSSALSCDYSIPAPPNGEKLDRSKVNVVHKPNGAASSALPYNQACNGAGWRYDDPNAPTRIVVCDASCEAIKAKPGQVDVLFGCETRTGGIK